MYAAVWAVKAEVWNLETFKEFPHVFVPVCSIAVTLSEIYNRHSYFKFCEVLKILYLIDWTDLF